MSVGGYGRSISGKAISTAKPKPKVQITDVTEEYIKNAKPNQGTITYEEGYKVKNHRDEIEIAEYLHRTFGGDITLLAEADVPNVKMPDYEWNDKLWELKTVTTEKSANRALRCAVKQIKENQGAVIFNYSKNEIDFDKLIEIIIKRYYMSGSGKIDIILITDNKNKVNVWRVKK